MTSPSPSPSRSRRDAGFTLVELLVVCVVLGVLAAIAIPVYLHQREKAADAAIKTDLRTVAQSEETYFTDTLTYLAVAATTAPVIDERLRLSPDVTVAVQLNAAGDAYCIVGTSPDTPRTWVHVSSRGGQQPAGTTTCPAAF